MLNYTQLVRAQTDQLSAICKSFVLTYPGNVCNRFSLSSRISSFSILQYNNSACDEVLHVALFPDPAFFESGSDTIFILCYHVTKKIVTATSLKR